MTDPIWLYLVDGTKTKNVACGTCKTIALTEDLARGCCKPRICTRCNENVCESPWTMCLECRQKRDEERDREAFVAARKVRACDWGSPVIVNDDGVASIDEMVDDFAHAGVEPPEYVWGTQVDRMEMSAERIVEWATEEMYDGAADDIANEAVAKLQQLLDAWISTHGPSPGYVEDRGVAIIDVPWERMGKDPDHEDG